MSSCRGHTQVLGDVLLHGGAPSEQKRIKFGAANWLQCSWDFCPSAFLLEANVALSRAEAVLPLFLHEVPLQKRDTKAHTQQEETELFCASQLDEHKSGYFQHTKRPQKSCLTLLSYLVKTQAACCTFTWTSTSSLLRLRCTCK